MNNPPQKTQALATDARLSVITITLAGIITTLHHAYGLSPHLLIPGAVLIMLPALLLRWFTRTRHRAALWAYGLLNVFIIVGLGIVDGFLDHTVRLSKAAAYNVLLPLHGGDPRVVEQVFSLLPPAPMDVFYEVTGMLTFIISLSALYFGYKFLRGVWKNETHS